MNEVEESTPAEVQQMVAAPPISAKADRVTTRTWELDLALAGKVYTPKTRVRRLWRQHIVSFVGREGAIETFQLRQTIPYCGHEAECPPSQSQYGAVCDFYMEPCETRSQAHTLLSARDYADKVASCYSFTAPRRRLLSLCTAAFILADRETRSVVKGWSIANWSGRIAGFGHARTYREVHKKVQTFATRLINDMRREGAEIFG